MPTNFAALAAKIPLLGIDLLFLSGKELFILVNALIASNSLTVPAKILKSSLISCLNVFLQVSQQFIPSTDLETL